MEAWVENPKMCFYNNESDAVEREKLMVHSKECIF